MAIGFATYTLHHPALGGIGTNSWHFRWDGPFEDGGGDVEAILDIIDEFYTGCNSLLVDTMSIEFDGEVKGLGPDEGSTKPMTTHGVGGTVAGGVLSPALAICVSWKASTGGRRGRGRTFLSPLANGVTSDDGTPGNSHVGTVRSAATELVASSTTLVGSALGVYSGLDGLLRDFTGSSVTDQFAVLRSRRD